MTTLEAFLELVANEEYIRTLPVGQRNKIRAYRAMYNSGLLKVKRIDTLLEENGYTLVSEPVWKHD